MKQGALRRQTSKTLVVAGGGLGVLVSLGWGCGSGGSDPASPNLSTSPEAGTANTPPLDAGPGPGGDAGRVVPGTLLVSGEVHIVGATDDGYIAYFLHAADGARSLEVFETKTKKSMRVGTVGSGNDTAAVRGKAVALWTNRKQPYGWGKLTVWTAASGVATAPGGSTSISSVLVANADASRLAFSSGEPPLPLGITNLAVSGPTFNPAPPILVTNVGFGTKLEPCFPSMDFAGTRLFVVSCEGSKTTGTVRSISDTNEVTIVRTDARPVWSADQSGSRVMVISATGDAEVHTLPLNDVTLIESGVLSGVLLPDGNSVVYTTATSALRRGASSAPVAAIDLVAAGVTEILSVSPDGKYALVASDPPDTQNTGRPRHDLQLASLTKPGVLTPILPTSTGQAYRFTRSGSHVLYFTDVPASGSTGTKVRARPVAGGAELVLSQNLDDYDVIVEPAGSTKIVYSERRPDLAFDVKVVDLEGGVAPKLLIDNVVSVTAYGKVVYVGVGEQGMYAMDLP